MMSQFARRTIEAVLLTGIVLVVYSSAAEAGETFELGPLQLNADGRGDVARVIRDSGDAEEFLETRYVDETRMPSLLPDEEQRGYVVFARHWMDLIFPNSIPQRGEITGMLETFATRGEYEPVTFCVRTLRKITGLEVKAGELVSQNGGRLAAPRVQLVRCAPRTWQGEEWLYPDGPVGVMNMPTYLEQARLADVAAGRTVQYWLTLKVDDDAEPGIYKGEIQINDRREKPYCIAIKVEVLPLKLLTPPHTLGFWDFQRPYRGEIGTLDQIHQVMREHGMNAVFARAGLFAYDKKTDAYDFSRYISVDDSGRVTVTLEGSPLGETLAAAKRAGFKHVIYTPHLSILVTRKVIALHNRKVLGQ